MTFHRGRGFVCLCELVKDVHETRVLTSVPLLAPGNTITFGIATIVDGERVGKRNVFVADWSNKTPSIRKSAEALVNRS